MNKEIYGVVYKITNTINGKCYIGQTSNRKGFNGRYSYSGNGAERVFKYYEYRKKNGMRFNDKLYKAMIKYGVDKFEVDAALDRSYSREELNLKEIFYIDKFNSINNGYNLKDGGDCGKYSQESKNKMSKNHADFSYGKSSKAKKVICLNTLYVFDSVARASDFYNCDTSEIVKCCKNKAKYCGVFDGECLRWMYYDDFLINKNMVDIKMKDDYVNFSGKNHHNSKRILCITTGKIFYGRAEAAKYYGIKSDSHIAACCRGSRNYCGKLPNGTKLKWKYLK